MINLDAYFARISYTGPRTPALSTLCAIHALHPAAIPFENLDPLLGRPVQLDLTALQGKLVATRRGGYCFEHNTLLKAVLEALGIAVTGLAARVLWRAPPGRPHSPRTHMVLRVDFDDGPWLADVGFGGYLFAAPLRLIPGLEQATPSGVLRLVQSDAGNTLQVRLGPSWQDLYRFTAEPQMPIDYEVANWFTSTHPASLFRTNLLMERLTPRMRISLFNTRLTRRHADGRVEEELLLAPEDLARTLAAEFDLDPPAGPAVLLARLPPP